jgi:hypothetical protein
MRANFTLPTTLQCLPLSGEKLLRARFGIDGTTTSDLAGANFSAAVLDAIGAPDDLQATRDHGRGAAGLPRCSNKLDRRN